MSPKVSSRTRPNKHREESITIRPPEMLLRKVPRQGRGHDRVDKILDAAAKVIAQTGVDGTTTNAIAAEAETSVGSLYQFFPNKAAIVEALAARYNSQLKKLNEETMPADASRIPLPELMQMIIMPAFEFYSQNPAYRHVFHALHGPDSNCKNPTGADSELHKAIIGRTEAMLASRAPHISQVERHIQATVAVLVTHALLSFAMAATPATREGLVAELKRLLVAYTRDVTTSTPATEHPEVVFTDLNTITRREE